MPAHPHASHTSHTPTRHGAHPPNGLPAEVIFPFLFLAPVLILAAWGFLKGQAGGGWRTSKGPTTISDYGDGLVAFGGATLLALFGLVQGGTLAVGGLLHLPKEPAVALLAMVFGAGILWVTWYFYQRRLTVMRVAKPGQLVVPHWPLRHGECLKVAYGRAIKPECRLRRLSAELQLFETCRHYDYHRKRYVTDVRLIERHNLGTGGARQTPEGLHAIFDVDVPHPDGSCPREGFAKLWAMLGFGPKRHWRLRVHLDVEGLPDDDSQFILNITEGQGQGTPVRRRRSRAA